MTQKENGLRLADWVTDEVYGRAMEMDLIKIQLWCVLPEQLKLGAGEKSAFIWNM